MRKYLTEKQLIRACLRGDRQAQFELYQQFKVYLFGVCMRYGKSKEEAEDILQEDFEASLVAQEAVLFNDRLFNERSSPYFRMDMGISYRINTKRMTHTIMLDIQNVTNRENLSGMFYDEITNQVEVDTQAGLFPFFNYRVEF